MEIKIIGARAANPIASDKIIKHAAAIFFSNGKSLQIDIGNAMEIPADYLTLSHMHFDHIGGIHTCPPQTDIYIPSRSFKTILAGKTQSPLHYFPPQKEIKIGDFTLTAFQVEHSQNTKAFGFRIEAEGKKITWLTDYRYLRNALKYFPDLDILFIGASAFSHAIYSKGGKEYGHMAIQTTLKLLKRYNIKPQKIFLVHLGKQLTPVPEKLKILKEKFPNFDLEAAFDGQKIFV